MNYTMFKALHIEIEKQTNTQVFFSFEAKDSKYEEFEGLGVPKVRILPPEKAVLMFWDAVFDAEFDTPWFRWKTTFVQIYHGVAAKTNYSKSQNRAVGDYRYHPNLRKYDLVFFINNTDYLNANNTGLLKYPDSGAVVGMSCLDEMMKNSEADKVKELKSKIIPRSYINKKIFLYTPTWDPTASFKRKGDAIIQALALTDAFVIIKPHPHCLNSMVGSSNSDIFTFAKKAFPKDNYMIVTNTPYEVMPISDLIVSDFSSITFEYSLLRKPIYLFVGKDSQEKVADKQQYDLLENCCYTFHEDDAISSEFFRVRPLVPEQLRAMVALQEKYFANVGFATEVAMQELFRRKLIVHKTS